MIIRGKNIEVTPAIRASIEKNMKRIESMGAHDIAVLVKTHPGMQTCEVTAATKFGLLRAEATDTDLYAAIDEVTARLKKQLVKAKERKTSHRTKEIAEMEVPEDIVRVKKISLKPMSDEEAIMQMELTDHDFYVYLNTEGDMRVIYKRKHGGYGVIA